MAKTERIGDKFYGELQEIQRERIERKIDKKKKGVSKLTDQITKHNSWKKMKEDLKNFIFIKDKKGLATADMFSFIFGVFFAIVLLGIYLYIFVQINAVLDITVDIGQVDLGTINAKSFGAVADAFIDSADFIGLAIIFSMVFGMLGSAFIFRGKYPRAMIIVDIFLLVMAFIVAVYVAQTYNLLINSSSEFDFYINNMADSSRFILNLPQIIGIIGALVMILSYSKIPRRRRNEFIGGLDT